MMMYHISESEILTHWSIETLIRKTTNGFKFLLLQNGFDSENENPQEVLNDDELIELFND